MRDYPDAVSQALGQYICLILTLSWSVAFQPAVLVRRHGTYSWGAGKLYYLASRTDERLIMLFVSLDWEKAKGQAECLDYLLEVAVKMKLAGMNTVGL